MSAAVRIELEARPLERIRADLAVAGIFDGDRPLRGGAARMDWRLCGLLSELVQAKQLGGAPGEALLVPTGGALRAPRALVVGLGDRERFRLTAAQEAMANAVGRCFALRVGRVALAPLGIAADDLPRHAAAVVGGVLEASRNADSALELVLTVPGRHQAATAAALQRAIRAVEPSSLSFVEPPPPEPVHRSPRGIAARPS